MENQVFQGDDISKFIIFIKLFIYFHLSIYLWLRWVFAAGSRLSLALVIRGYSLVALHVPLTAVASLAEEHKILELGPNSCGTQLKCPLGI